MKIKSLIINSNSNYNPFLSIKKLLGIAKNNESVIQFYRKNNFESIYYDLGRSMFKFLEPFKMSSVDHYGLITKFTKEKEQIDEPVYTQIFAPIFQYKAINQFFFLNDQEWVLKHQRVELKFKFFLPKMKWATNENIILFTGGNNEDNDQPVKNSYIFNALSEDIKDKDKPGETYKMLTLMTDMNHARQAHTMAVFNDIFFVVAGGDNTDTCEIFSLIRNSWDDLPRLNQIRGEGTLYVHNKYLLYIFGGYNFEKKYINTVEELDTGNVEVNTWKEIEIKNPDNLKIEKACMGILKIKKNNIILFGGKYMDNYLDREVLSDETMNFDFSTKTFSSNNRLKMTQKGYFNETQFLVLVDNTNIGSKVLGQFVYNDDSISIIGKIPHVERFKIDKQK